MGFEVKVRTCLEGAVAVVASALLFYFGNGMQPVWPLMWFAWVPLLWFSLRTPWWCAGAASVAMMLLGSLNLWSYLTKTMGEPGSAWFSIFFVVALIFTAGTLLFRSLVLRGAVWSGLIALPATWVTMEYLRNLTTPHGTVGSIAYSQLHFLLFLQLASITGPWGMSFFLLLFSSAIVVWLHLRKFSDRRARRILAAGAAPVIVILLFGAVRLAMPTGPTVRVGLIASDLKQNELVVAPGTDTERLIRDYAQSAKALIAKGAQAIVIPEKLGVTIEGRSTAATDAVLQYLADQTGTTIVAGVVDVDGSVKFNEARVYARGESVQRYHKEHLLPPFESNMKPGTALTLLPRQGQKWGVAICKDMDFRSPAQLYGRAGAGLMLVPGWDFVVDRTWHGHIAIMRGVEEGFSVARAAKDGFLTASDDRGRILGEERSNAAPFSTLLVDIPDTHHWTLYQSFGDWFAWVAVAALIAAISQAMRIWLVRRNEIPPAQNVQ